MMDIGDLADHCMNAMGSMMGGGMMGNSIMPLVLLLVLLLFVWVFGLAAVGALIFWVARRWFADTRSSGS